MIDLRSDTATKPTPEMRRAMAEAGVGDDVLGEDPTVNALQERVADLMGKEAALFVASGTMANLISIKSLTQPGDEVICDAKAHVFDFEGGGAALFSGVQLHPLAGERGILRAEQVEAAIRPHDHHFAPTRVISLENTHNNCGGTVYPIDEIEEIHELAQRHGLAMHLDGARLLNACAVTGISAREYAKLFDAVSICLSKGLGAPVGSVIAGSADFVDRAHRFRKLCGGGMRQAGIVAAAGIYALDNNVERLKEDHDNAKILAEGLSRINGIEIKPDEVETNIVFFDVSGSGLEAREFSERLRKMDVLVNSRSGGVVRVVTHLGISEEDVSKALQRVAEMMSSC